MDEVPNEIDVADLLKSTPFYFINKVFGYSVSGCHEEMLDFFMNTQHGLLLCPRGSGKSKIAQGYVAWLALHNPDMRIIIISDSDGKATLFLNTIKNVLEYSPIIKEYYSDVRGEVWTEHAITIKGRTFIQTEPTVMSVGSGSGRVTGLHADLILMDDIESFDSARSQIKRDRLQDWYKTTLAPVLMADGATMVCACLPTDTKILMGNGTWNNIQDITIGDKVYSFDTINNKLVIKDVENVIYQGKDKIYEIKTSQSTIRANSNHPFLVIEPTSGYVNNKIDDYNYEWKQLQELKIGDRLLTINKINNGDNDEFSSDLYWLFGFMTGDGWVTKNIHNNGKTDKEYVGYKVCVSPGIYNNITNRVLTIFKNEFNINLKDYGAGYYLATSKKVGEFFVNNGLKSGAKNKDIPDWVFKSSLKNRQYFIKGLLDADGWIANRKQGQNKNRNYSTEWRINSSSKKLIKDLKLLCNICGYKTGNIGYREGISQPPNSPKPIHSESWSLYISLKNKLFKMIVNDAKEKFPTNNFRFEIVKKIDCVSYDDIWDLTVSDTHNFIAEGFVTHNTRYHPSDIYQMLLNEFDFNQLILPAIDKEGNSICEWLLPLHDVIKDNGKVLKGLDSIKTSLGSVIYALQYDNDVELLKAGTIFKYEDFRFYDKVIFKDNNIYVNLLNGTEQLIKRIVIGIDLAISEKQTADYTAMVLIGKSNTGDIYVLDYINKRLSFNAQVELIENLVVKWEPNEVVIEQVAYQAAMIDELRRRGGLKIMPVTPTRDKVARAYMVSGMVEGNLVHFKQKGMSDVTDNLTIFPDGTHDDLTDAFVYGMSRMKVGTVAPISISL